MDLANLRRVLTAVVLPLAPTVVAVVGSACGSSNGSAFDAGTTAADASQEGGGLDAHMAADGPCLLGCSDAGDARSTWSDFPMQPVLDMPDAGPAAPAGSAGLFGPPSQGAQTGGPCLVEPEVGSLYPQNWLRPRFAWITAGGENLFELRLHVANQTSELLVYTTSTEWTMPKSMWDALRVHSPDEAMTLTIRGAVLSGSTISGEALGSSGPLGIAPVSAPGTVVYWSIQPGPGITQLKGFAIGDESVTPVLLPSQVTEFSTGCIGCHNATPDGAFASFTSQTNNWQNGFANIQAGMTGQVPPWLGAAGKAAVETAQLGIHTFSPAHWSAGDRIEISGNDPQDNGQSQLIWIDLEATTAPASGTLARTGDPNYAGAPSWSHDGKTIAYVSTNANKDGRLDDGAADVWTVPYAAKAGGTASALPGASANGMRNFYPSWSPDDKLIAFDEVASGNMYNNALDEVYVVPGGGGKATRLAANDPPACTTKKSPGVTNGWPKWAPQAQTTPDGRTFYWVVFSSVRDAGGNPQLYVTPVVVDAKGGVTTYHALYLWNQPPGENNHTPAWDYFQIPPPGSQ